MKNTPNASLLERAVFLFRLIFLPLFSFSFFGNLLGISIMAVFFRKSLSRSVEYILPKGLILVGWGVFSCLVFLLFYALAQRGALRRTRALLGEFSWARQGWWTLDGQRILGLVGVAQGHLVAAALDGSTLSHDFTDVRALELLPARGPLQVLLGHGTLRVFRANGETWDALVCGSRKALQGMRTALELQIDPADQTPQHGASPS